MHLEITTMNIKEKLKSYDSGYRSNWLQELELIEKNEAWLTKSVMIAISVLKALEAKGMTQKELADKLNVSPQAISKILKGKENVTLETISNLENALNITLVQIPEYEPERFEIVKVPESVKNQITLPFQLPFKALISGEVTVLPFLDQPGIHLNFLTQKLELKQAA